VGGGGGGGGFGGGGVGVFWGWLFWGVVWVGGGGGSLSGNVEVPFKILYLTARQGQVWRQLRENLRSGYLNRMTTEDVNQ